MSIYLRYALYYNCRRYLGEIERVKDIASQYNSIDDFPRDEAKVETTTRRAGRAGPELCQEDMRVDSDDHDMEGETGNTDPSTENEEHTCHTASDSEGSGSDSGEELSSATSASEDAFAKDQPTTTGEEDIHDSTDGNSAYPPSDNGYNFSVSEFQMDRLLTCHRVVAKIVSSLERNINLVKKQRDETSSSLIGHLWSEAARLNGSEPAKLPCKQSMPLDWWFDDGDNTTEANGLPTGCKSPLVTQFTPEDLLWKDEVCKYQLSTGRAMDECGRRYIKL